MNTRPALSRQLTLLALWGASSLAAAASRVDGPRMVEAAQAALQQQLAPHATRVALQARQTPDAVPVPDGELSLRVEADTASWSPSMRTVVVIEVDGRAVRRVPVWFAVAAYAPGVVAVQDLPAGHQLTAADLQPASVNLAALGQARADAGEALVGQRLKHAVPQGRAVLARHVEASPEVLRGERVVVELEQPGMALAAPGVALADARLGQAVRVRMAQADVLTATVVGARRARLKQDDTP